MIHKRRMSLVIGVLFTLFTTGNVFASGRINEVTPVAIKAAAAPTLAINNLPDEILLGTKTTVELSMKGASSVRYSAYAADTKTHKITTLITGYSKAQDGGETFKITVPTSKTGEYSLTTKYIADKVKGVKSFKYVVVKKLSTRKVISKVGATIGTNTRTKNGISNRDNW